MVVVLVLVMVLAMLLFSFCYDAMAIGTILITSFRSLKPPSLKDFEPSRQAISILEKHARETCQPHFQHVGTAASDERVNE